MNDKTAIITKLFNLMFHRAQSTIFCPNFPRFMPFERLQKFNINKVVSYHACTNIKHAKDAINFHYFRISLVKQIVVGIKQRYRNYAVSIRLNIPSARKPLPITCPPRKTLPFSPNPQNSGI